MSRNRLDLECIKQFQNGDIGAFEKLVSQYSEKAYSLAFRLTKNQEDAEEVLQDVFVSVFRKIDGFEGKSSFSSWLYRVTVNASFMKLRKRRQDRTVKLDDLSSNFQEALIASLSERDEISEFLKQKELRDKLHKAIDALPPSYKPVFVLRDIDGLATEEVAGILKITVPAVKSRLHRSRLILRKKLANFYNEYRFSKELQGRPIASNC